MAESTICPYCNARLRLSTSSRRPNRVKCRICHRSFHPSQVMSGNESQRLNEPLTSIPHSHPGDRGPHDVDANESTDRTSPTDAAHDHAVEAAPRLDELSINPTVVEAAFPDAAARRSARRNAARERIKERISRRRSHKMKPHQVVLAIAMLTAGAGGAAYLGWYLLGSKLTSETVADLPPTREVAVDNPIAPLLAKDLAPKPLPRRLIGTWELRSDDDRRGWVEYRSDGTMSAHAWEGNVQKIPTHDQWHLVEEVGDEITVEFGAQKGSLGNPRYILVLTGSDAYTLTQILHNSVRSRADQRFVKQRMRSDKPQ